MSELEFASLNPLGVQGNFLDAVNRVLSLLGVTRSNPMSPAAGPELPPRNLPNCQEHNPSLCPTRCESNCPNECSPSRKAISRSSSTLSIPFDIGDEADIVRVEGLKHADGRLEAR